MEKHLGKAFYRLTRLAPGDELPLKRKPWAKVYANPLETQALPPPEAQGPPLYRVFLRLRPKLPEVLAPLSLQDLSQILLPLSDPGGGRLVPSAGEAYPFEVYALALALQGVFPGVYHYAPKEHRLYQLAPLPPREGLEKALMGLSLEATALALVFTLAPERSEALFGLRGYRYALMEMGYAVGLVLMAVVGRGLSAYPAQTFYDGELARLLALPEGEYPGAVLLIGH